MKHTLVAMLRVKNQIITIRECLDRLSRLVDEIVIVDNGSTDGTLSAYKQFDKIVAINQTRGFDEGRDKILALEMAKERKPDWIIWLDGDEIIEEWVTRTDLENYMYQDDLNQVDFRMFNFWKSKDFFRVDGDWRRYTAFPQRAMWRNVPEAYFDNLPFHNGGIRGITTGHLLSEIRLKHYGYIESGQIATKNTTYRKLENDTRAYKTMSTSEEDLELEKWVSGKQAALNQKLYWDKVEKSIKRRNSFKGLVKHVLRF